MINALLSFAASLVSCYLIVKIMDAPLERRNRELFDELYRALNDLQGHCDVCVHYDVGQYLRCMGDCSGCRRHPNGGSLDNWKWRGEK